MSPRSQVRLGQHILPKKYDQTHIVTVHMIVFDVIIKFIRGTLYPGRRPISFKLIYSHLWPLDRVRWPLLFRRSNPYISSRFRMCIVHFRPHPQTFPHLYAPGLSRSLHYLTHHLLGTLLNRIVPYFQEIFFFFQIHIPDSILSRSYGLHLLLIYPYLPNTFFKKCLYGLPLCLIYQIRV